jgi:hypothetical protein
MAGIALPSQAEIDYQQGRSSQVPTGRLIEYSYLKYSINRCMSPTLNKYYFHLK